MWATLPVRCWRWVICVQNLRTLYALYPRSNITSDLLNYNCICVLRMRMFVYIGEVNTFNRPFIRTQPHVANDIRTAHGSAATILSIDIAYLSFVISGFVRSVHVSIHSQFCITVKRRYYCIVHFLRCGMIKSKRNERKRNSTRQDKHYLKYNGAFCTS